VAILSKSVGFTDFLDIVQQLRFCLLRHSRVCCPNKNISRAFFRYGA